MKTNQSEIKKLSEAINESLAEDIQQLTGSPPNVAEIPSDESHDVESAQAEAITLGIENLSLTIVPSAIASEAWSVERLVFWADMLGRCERAVVNADAQYRNYRARSYKAMLEQHPKIASAEWKVKAVFESTEMFTECKRQISEATRNLRIVEGVLQSFKDRAPLDPGEV